MRRHGVSSDGHGAGEDAVLQHDAEHQEQEVEQEHGEAQAAAHPPAAGRDGDDDEEEHEEEQHDGAEEAVGVHGDGLVAVRQRVHEPGDGQAGEHTRTACVTFLGPWEVSRGNGLRSRSAVLTSGRSKRFTISPRLHPFMHTFIHSHRRR